MPHHVTGCTKCIPCPSALIVLRKEITEHILKNTETHKRHLVIKIYRKPAVNPPPPRNITIKTLGRKDASQRKGKQNKNPPPAGRKWQQKRTKSLWGKSSMAATGKALSCIATCLKSKVETPKAGLPEITAVR